jgi:hypothetical protein
MHLFNGKLALVRTEAARFPSTGKTAKRVDSSTGGNEE